MTAESGHNDCTLSYTLDSVLPEQLNGYNPLSIHINNSINLTGHPAFLPLRHRHNVTWNFTFDNIESHYEFVTPGTGWNQLLSNINCVSELTQTQGHTAIVYAEYSIYNATRLRTFHQFAREKNLKICWQYSCPVPCANPACLGADVVALCRSEIKLLLLTDLCTCSEREFLNDVLDNHCCTDDLSYQFCNHIREIENKYHIACPGKFAKLWPEIARII